MNSPAGPWNGWGHMWGSGSGWMWGGFMMLFWIGLIALVVWLVARAFTGQDLRSSLERSGLERAHEVLAERYASGEISTDEYRDRLDHLDHTG
ncbi:hypothetical protein [Nonomuraea sp. NPDC048901]|uniref:SHOCT domain-containing protein n=2 Tax=Nonomuraea TaxID=83681 RepID=UPI0033CA3E5F